MGNKRDLCACGELKYAASAKCKKCSLSGMAESLRTYQLEKYKNKYAGTAGERVCECGNVFYAMSRKICSVCKRNRAKSSGNRQGEDSHKNPAIAELRRKMKVIMRPGANGKMARCGYRCTCGAPCVERRCVSCEMYL